MPRNSDREYRAVTLDVGTMTGANEETPVLEGYAATFSQPYLLWEDRADRFRMTEEIDPHAFDECDMSDVIMQVNHEGRVYARTRNNTLSLKPDSHGLWFRSDMSRTDGAKQLHQEVRAGMLGDMSIGFIVGEDEKRYTRDDETGWEVCHRTIKKFRKLYDISVVSIPANDQTTVSARGLTEGLIREVQQERQHEREKRRLSVKLRILKNKMEGKCND